MEVSHLQPISLCHSPYKIIGKVLVNLIEPVLRNIVSEFQNAFVLGRQTSNNYFPSSWNFKLGQEEKKGKFLRMNVKSSSEQSLRQNKIGFL